MDLIISIIQAYSMVNDATKIYGTTADWVFDFVNKWSDKKSDETIEDQVAQIATLTEADVRSKAQKTFAKQPTAGRSELAREEMTGLLINLSRNVRTRVSVASLASVSGFFRTERLLDLLTMKIEPVRHINEPVSEGSPWKLKRHLGIGSFGEVWLAENPYFPNPRAYKFFTSDGSGEWLKREQESLFSLSKRIGQIDQIIDFEDVQVDARPYPFLAFEYMGGGSLEEWILNRREKRVPLEPGTIVQQVAMGLAAAHENKIQHRDIKPANILLTEGPDSRIKIGDFGLAKVAASGAARLEPSQLASLAGTVGTLLYLPPESQQRNFRRKAEQDDVFALGVVWFQLIMGAIERPPYDFARRLAEKGANSHTIRIIERCLAHPDRRFLNAGELLAAVGDEIPAIQAPVPGIPDIQHLAIEYLASTLINMA